MVISLVSSYSEQLKSPTPHRKSVVDVKFEIVGLPGDSGEMEKPKEPRVQSNQASVSVSQYSQE